ncbi:uncharacterized protein [Eurosta solidaginis]|uniref:uncharacterized protein n=1 Tax=Eurosta solidaginis TaxID=178769 RepID=UPI0035317CE6
MKLTIKTLDQRNYQVETTGIKTVWDLKRRIFNSATTNLLPERQQLIYAGRVLKDKILLSHYAIDERKFILVLSRKQSKANNSNVNTIPVNNNNNPSIVNSVIRKKVKRLAKTTQTIKPNEGQGDGPDIICTNKRKCPSNSKKSTNTQDKKNAKTTTSMTGFKSLNMPKSVLPAHASRKKVKITRMYKSTSSGCSPQDGCIAKRHFPTSTSSISSSDAQDTRRYKTIQRHKTILRNRGGMNKMKTGNQRHSKAVGEKQCDEIVLQQIVAMGYNEQDVRRALIASFNEPNDAVDYLIKKQVQERVDKQSARKQKQQQHFQQRKQQQQTQKHCRIVTKVKPKKSNALGFLRHDADFKNLRRILRVRPNILQNVVKRIATAHPEILALLKEYEDDFLQLLDERSVDSDEDQCSSCLKDKTMHISPEEERIIARLMRMGFKRHMVILAFIACDRNVEKAVEYLCRIGDIQI